MPPVRVCCQGVFSGYTFLPIFLVFVLRYALQPHSKLCVPSGHTISRFLIVFYVLSGSGSGSPGVTTPSILGNDRSILAENGGYLKLSNDWARKILYKMETLGRKMTRQLATTSKAPIAPGVLKETKLHFQRKIKQLQ